MQGSWVQSLGFRGLRDPEVQGFGVQGYRM